jgi:hypothetical protein
MDFIDKNVENSISNIIASKNELSTEVSDAINNLPTINIKDQQYLEDKIKDLIKKSELMIDNLSSEINGEITDENGNSKKVLSAINRISAYNAYAIMTNSLINALKELRELNKMVMGLDIVNSDTINKNKGISKDKNIKLSSSELLKLLNEAQKSKEEENKIDADYEIIK